MKATKRYWKWVRKTKIIDNNPTLTTLDFTPWRWQCSLCKWNYTVSEIPSKFPAAFPFFSFFFFRKHGQTDATIPMERQGGPNSQTEGHRRKNHAFRFLTTSCRGGEAVLPASDQTPSDRMASRVRNEPPRLQSDNRRSDEARAGQEGLPLQVVLRQPVSAPTESSRRLPSSPHSRRAKTHNSQKEM